MLVGDIIEKVRTLVVDQPQVLPSPTIQSVTPITGDGTVGPGPYFLVATITNQWGETSPSAEVSGTLVLPNTSLQIVVNVATYDRGYNTTGVNIYLGTAAGGEVVKFSFPGVTAGQTLTISSSTPQQYQNPPQRNTAYNPDSDGSTFSATYIFNLLTEALHQASLETGGIKDYSGMPTIANNPFYVLQGQWPAITDLWYNGYWMQGGDRGWFFRRNTITSQILTTASMSIIDNRSILEIYPQPDRTAGTTKLVNPMGAADTSCLVADSGFVLLPFGFIQIDSEIMGYYGLNGNTLQLSPRGIGGNPAAAHGTGAIVTELNLFFAGKRIFETTYQPGQSLTVLPTPSGWGSLLEDYMMYRIRQDEQEDEKAQAYYKAFIDKAHSYAASNKQPMKRRQIGQPSTPQVFFETPTGGLILP